MNHLTKKAKETFSASKFIFRNNFQDKYQTLFWLIHQSLEFYIKGFLLDQKKLDHNDKHHSIEKLCLKYKSHYPELFLHLQVFFWLDDFNGGKRYDNNKLPTDFKNIFYELENRINKLFTPVSNIHKFNYPEIKNFFSYSNDVICILGNLGGSNNSDNISICLYFHDKTICTSLQTYSGDSLDSVD